MKAKRLKKLPKKAKPIDLMHAYMARNAEFTAMLEERTPGEVAYDDAVTASMREGLSMEEALKVGAERHPEEALHWDEASIEGIKVHYEYLVGHEDILAKVAALNKRR